MWAIFLVLTFRVRGTSSNELPQVEEARWMMFLVQPQKNRAANLLEVTVSIILVVMRRCQSFPIHLTTVSNQSQFFRNWRLRNFFGIDCSPRLSSRGARPASNSKLAIVDFKLATGAQHQRVVATTEHVVST